MSILRFIRWIDEGTSLEVFGDGTQTRDFTYVEDIARGTALASISCGFEIINLGGGRAPVSIHQMIAFIEERLAKKARISYQPALKADIKETRADIRKAKRLLEWEPEVDIFVGLTRTMDWYLANRDFVRGLKL